MISVEGSKNTTNHATLSAMLEKQQSCDGDRERKEIELDSPNKEVFSRASSRRLYQHVPNSIDVAVRVRPIDGETLMPKVMDSFSYFSTVVLGSNQSECFNVIGSPLVSRMREGYNTTVLAYGQTGSGKTYTMFGPTGSLTEVSLHGEGTAPPLWGIFPRIALNMVRTRNGASLEASAIEVYNNAPFDLLNDRKPLQLAGSSRDTVPRVTSKRGPDKGASFTSQRVGINGEHPKSCTCHDCFKAHEAVREVQRRRIAAIRNGRTPVPSFRAKLDKKGVSRRGKRASNAMTRTVGETLWSLKTPADVARFARQIEISRVAHGHALNERSSRSHCIVRLVSTQASRSSSIVRQQCFTFVDLAGSERTGKTCVAGQRMSEAIGINSSLTVLGRCIRAIGSGKRHVPWRDAVLCQLLRASFESGGGGGSYATVVVTISPEHEDETLCTLRFGESVSCVMNRATIVVGRSATREIHLLKKQIQELLSRKTVLENAGHDSGFVKGCIHSQQVMLQENMNKLATIHAFVKDLKARRIEVSATSKSSAPESESRKVRSKLVTAQKEEEVVRGVVERQQTIKKLWRQATPLFESLVAELREKENQLRALTDN